MKICCTCRTPKSISLFHKDRTSPDGYSYSCKECANKRTLLYYKKNRNARLAYIKGYRNGEKMEVLRHYSGDPPHCQCQYGCPETLIQFLSIDHINNDGAKHRKSIFKRSRGGQMYHWLIVHNFPPGFQVLCHNCNFGKHINGGICPHSLKIS